MYAVVFRFGAFQIVSDNPIIHEEFENIFRTFIALVFGAFSIGQASAFAPNYAKAKLSANRIFFLLDREPVIDNYSQEGQKLVSLVCLILGLQCTTLIYVPCSICAVRISLPVHS